MEGLKVSHEAFLSCPFFLFFPDKCPHPRGQSAILHGSTIRNYTTKIGFPETELPGSAVIVFVVDESGSMVGEHEWLRRTVPILEHNLYSRGVGKSIANQYALVGFAHNDPTDPTRQLGKVLQDCGTASLVANELSSLHTDGRLEDGYSAIDIALKNVSCLRDIEDLRAEAACKGIKVACQIILATDEGRDNLNDSLNKEKIRDMLREKGCILNIVINERMRGRMTKTGEWQRALGVASNNQSVVADLSDRFSIYPIGEAVEITGHENTHEAYVDLAMQTSGAAWDLNMLRTERYENSFTNGFIEVKVQEIRRQILGQCDDCTCKDGFWECREIGGVQGEGACLFPSRTDTGQS